MAANDYYNSSPSRPHPNRLDAPLPHSPHQSFSAYNSNPTPPVAPYMSSTVHSPYEDSDSRPYEHSVPSPHYASGVGGREHEQNSYPDNIPLRQSPSKGESGMMMQDPLADDPAIIDRPKDRRSRRKKKRGFFSGRIPYVVWTLTLIQVVVFIAELAKNGVLTKTPIEVKPSFNPMIGPSPYVLINMGARYVPCMRVSSYTTQPAPCPNTTTSTLSASQQCSLNELCGFGDHTYSTGSPPHQWYRFIIPIFLHAGIIHITFNMLLQLLLGCEIEREIGSLRFIIVYLSSGVFGFVLGGNLAPPAIASTGASGSLFGIIALLLLDLFYHWHEKESPWWDLTWIMVDMIISFVLGLLPGVDNFSHIGGFLMGIVLGICILHTPDVFRRRVGADLPPYASIKQSRRAMDTGGIQGFIKEPLGFFKGRKPLWWAWWLVRAAALIGALIGFIALVRNFYKADPTTCEWCKYLSCINIKNWCNVGNLQLTNTTTNGTTKRDLFSGPRPISLEILL